MLRSPLDYRFESPTPFSDEGELLNIIASVRDITRFREAEAQNNFISVISYERKPNRSDQATPARSDARMSNGTRRW